MEKIHCAVDTSAVLSLGASGKLQLAVKLFSFTIPSRVKDELHEVSGTSDTLGNIATDILKSPWMSFLSLDGTLQSDSGEIEVINLANRLKSDIALMDDIKARKKLKKKCQCPIRFSPYVIFVLCEKKLITLKEARAAIEQMKTKREWKENLITEYAELLLGGSVNHVPRKQASGSNKLNRLLEQAKNMKPKRNLTPEQMDELNEKLFR